ncbi:MAG: cytochrome C [Desulfuromonadales bacterium]|nr:cytochrome C [Desulfuromonadales bacterium]
MKRSVLFLFFLVTFVTCSAYAGAGTGTENSDKTKEFYPYFPSLIKWNKSDVNFTPPQTCGECHEKQYSEWSSSIHSVAFQDPIYQGELNQAFKAVGHSITKQCEGCHSPAGMVTGEVKQPGTANLSPMASAGVSCDICHSVSGVTHLQTPTHEPENGSFILTPGENGEPVKRVPFPPTQDCGGGFHGCVESTLHQTSELCASCHNVFHYETNFPLEKTYNEWKFSPYEQHGIQCQDCHMVDIKTFKDAADNFRKPSREEHHHYFNGPNYLLSYLSAGAAKKAGNDDLATRFMLQYDMAVERLKSAADIEIMPVYSNNELTELKVRVKNIRSGHNMPTSLTNIRQMWLEVTVKDENGKVIMTSGAVKDGEALPPDTRVFNSDGMDKNFKFAVDPWEIVAFSKHDTIPPRGHRDVYYGVRIPENVKNITVEVRLRYRQADQKIAEALLAAVPESINLKAMYGLDKVPPLPIVDMASKTGTFATGCPIIGINNCGYGQ